MANEKNKNNNNTKPSAPKKYNAISELDAKQKNDIAAWAYEIYCDFCKANGEIPSEPEQVAEIAGKLSRKMSAGKILMPEKPVQVYVNSKMASF
ncbi:MAG: hypothetical protein MJ068_05375, partial [Clostridia bacterium]|nr:hypothetical protein [Clostridia bacterium]